MGSTLKEKQKWMSTVLFSAVFLYLSFLLVPSVLDVPSVELAQNVSETVPNGELLREVPAPVLLWTSYVSGFILFVAVMFNLRELYDGRNRWITIAHIAGALIFVVSLAMQPDQIELALVWFLAFIMFRSVSLLLNWRAEAERVG
ncbi:MAG: hypothetical protein ACN2B6_09940 [Rickettsiales bacterium]